LYGLEVVSLWGHYFWTDGLVYDNGLLRDMIKIGDVAVFINDVMVGTETEEGYNNIVEEVLRRIVENDLFVKLEKLCRRLERLDF